MNSCGSNVARSGTVNQPDRLAFWYEVFMMTLNGIDLGVLLVDSMDCITFANSKAVSLLECSKHAILGSRFGDFMEKVFAPHISNHNDLAQWLEMLDAASSLSMEDLHLDCEIEYVNNIEKRILKLLAIPVSNAAQNRLKTVIAIHDLSGQRKAERILESVSDAVREMNVDLRIDEMLNRLFEIVRHIVDADAMAILWSSSPGNAGGVILGSIPVDFLGGAGIEGLLLAGTHEQGLLVDIIADVEHSLDNARVREEQANSLFSTVFLEKVQQAGMQSLIALPLKLFGSVSGIWVTASRKRNSYNHADVTFLGPVSEHLAVAVKNAVLLHRTRAMYSAAVRALAATVDIRDTYTLHHSENVAAIAKIIATEMGLPREEVEIIELAGLVHDIGKVGIPDEILNKPGPLAPSEMAVMTHHSVLGATILERAGMLSDLAPMVLHHHEWHNGSGYPAGLKGGQIPTGAAILSVADAFDTMISHRIYKNAMPLEGAVDELRRCAGGQFDPAVVNALGKAVQEALDDPGSKYNWLRNVLRAEELGLGPDVVSYGPRTLAEQQGVSRDAITSKELSVIFRITQEMRRLLDLDDLLNHILYIVSTEMHYSDCSILLPDEEGDNLVMSAGLGMSQNSLGLKIPRGTGISWWVMDHGQPQNVPDVGVDERHYEGTPGVASEVYVPLEVRGKRLGVLLVQKAEKYGFTPTDVRLLMAVAGHIASALEVAQLHSQVKKAAETDSLTGLHNRRSTVTALDGFIADARSNKGPGCIAIVLLDVDRLKLVNDNYGHLAGDRVLIHIAEHLSRGFRSNDIVGRFGGDEFIVLLPGVSPELAGNRVKQVISGWLDAKLMDSLGREIPVPSASFGVSCYPIDGIETRVLMATADNKLLAAKSKTHASTR